MLLGICSKERRTCGGGRTFQRVFMSGKRKNKVKEKVKKIEVLPADGTTVPAVPAPAGAQVYRACSVHVDTTFRVGGFCEKCYGEETKNRIMKLDAKLDDLVISQLDTMIERILDSDDNVLIERFLSRIMKRFSRPETKHIKAQMQAVHLHGPVDFGRPD